MHNTENNKANSTKWHAVTASYKAVHLNKPRKRHLWERITFLMLLPPDADAMARAQQIAEEKQLEYVAANGDTVRWVLQGISDIKELFDEKLQDGTEVGWEFSERVDRHSAE